MQEPRQIIATGVPGLDTILGGGLPARQTLVVTGNPGTGKTLLCSQIAFAQAARGVPVVVATVTSEPHDKLLDELSAFAFFDEKRLGEEMFFLSAYPWLKKGAKDARELILGTVRERNARLIFIDGLRSIRDLWADEAKLREFMYDLGVGLSASNCVGLMSTEYEVDRLMGYPEATTVDGIISLSVARKGPRRVRHAEVVKLRGRAHLSGAHTLAISGSGVEVYPRFESVAVRDAGYAPSKGRAGFGLAELDKLLDGGLPRDSATLIVGSTGIGKTLLALHFASAGAGEKGLFLSFYEPARSLVERAKRIGLELESRVATGELVIDYAPPIELDADRLITGILRQIDSLGARRLVIDGISELERAIGEEERVRDFLVALLLETRRRSVSIIFTKEIAKIAGAELDFSETPTSLIAENLLFLRHVEMNGRLHRILSILKMRASSYDANLREFEITGKGFAVLEPLRTATGLLTGLPRPVSAGAT